MFAMNPSKLTKFPFKSMIPIIEYLNSSKNESAKELSISDIMDASNACFPDTFEVVQMVAYLTAFGQVKMQDNSWSIINKQEIKVARAFRELFLTDVVKILNQLSPEPQQVTVISNNVNGPKEQEIIEYLTFLEKLTAYGFVKKGFDGWSLQPYESSNPVEINST